jgi:hypothetical protein
MTGEGRLPSTGDGRLPWGRRRTGHRATHIGSRRRGDAEATLQESGHRWNEVLSSAAVILAGVLVVVGFGFVAARAMRSDDTPPNLSEPAAPALGQVTIPSPDQNLIPLDSPSPSPSKSSPSPTPAPTDTSPPPDPGAIAVSRGAVPSLVDLTAEGKRDWVHWGEDGTFSLERDKKGGFAILEGAPTAPRFRHALSPQRFAWTGGDPVDHSDGTPTGIRTCGKDNGFTITAPAADTTRTLKLYIGVVSAKGRLQAKLSAGSATGSTTLDQHEGTLKTAVLSISYRAPKTAQLRLSWITEDTYGTGCAGVALQAATLR